MLLSWHSTQNQYLLTCIRRFRKFSVKRNIFLQALWVNNSRDIFFIDNYLTSVSESRRRSTLDCSPNGAKANKLSSFHSFICSLIYTIISTFAQTTSCVFITCHSSERSEMKKIVNFLCEINLKTPMLFGPLVVITLLISTERKCSWV